MSLLKCGLIVEGKDIKVPLKESDITVTLQGFIANVDCQLTYANDTADPLQTSFVFPMDDMSAVYKFEADVNKKHIIAECQDKKQAQKTYDEAISAGHTAMLLSEDDSAGDIFECKLGNLPAGETAKLTMSYVVELSVEPEGKMRFTVPTVLNPRYSPDVGHLVEAGKPTRGEVDIKTPCKLSFKASVSGHHTIQSVSSSTDKLNVDIGENKLSANVQLAEDFKFDHDLSFDVVYVDLNKPEVIFELGNPDKEGLLKEDLLMLNFYPDIKQGEATEESRREFIFVIDRSGSMNGIRIQKAKETLLLLLKSLPVGCLFNVVSFGSDFTSLFDQSQEYNENTLKEAIGLQKKMDADMGGTEILRPLESIYSKSCKPAYPRQIFLMTDGEVSNTNDVISLVRKNKGNTRVFTFGIGDGVSTSLIKQVANATNGKAIFIKDKDNMQAKVIEAMKGSLDDCLSEVSLTWNIPSCFSVTNIPTEPPVIFHGEKLVLFALLKSSDKKKDASGSLEVKGTISGKPMSYKVNIDQTGSSHPDLPLHRVAAKYQIKQLEIDDNGNSWRDGVNKDRIVLVSQAANIISKYTAFVGVDKETKVPVSVVEERIQLEVQPQMMFAQDINCVIERGEELDWLEVKADKLANSAKIFNKKRKGFSLPSFSMPKLFSKFSKHHEPEAMSISAYPSMHLEHSYDSMPCSAPPPPPQRMAQNMMQCSDESDESMEPSDKESADVMMKIVSLQHFDGSWSSSTELAAIIDVSEQELTSKYKPNIWCTAIVLVFLEKNFSERKSEWEMLFNKAVKWMNSQDREGKSTQSIIQEVKDANIVKNI